MEIPRKFAYTDHAGFQVEVQVNQFFPEKRVFVHPRATRSPAILEVWGSKDGAREAIHRFTAEICPGCPLSGRCRDHNSGGREVRAEDSEEVRDFIALAMQALCVDKDSLKIMMPGQGKRKANLESD